MQGRKIELARFWKRIGPRSRDRGEKKSARLASAQGAQGEISPSLSSPQSPSPMRRPSFSSPVLPPDLALPRSSPSEVARASVLWARASGRRGWSGAVAGAAATDGAGVASGSTTDGAAYEGAGRCRLRGGKGDANLQVGVEDLVGGGVDAA